MAIDSKGRLRPVDGRYADSDTKFSAEMLHHIPKPQGSNPRDEDIVLVPAARCLGPVGKHAWTVHTK